jgi:hypothetical protein
LKARQERFKDQLDKLPVSATGNSKPTATSASDLEAKKKVSPRPECLGSNTVRLRDIWPVAKLAGRSTYSAANCNIMCFVTAGVPFAGES